MNRPGFFLNEIQNLVEIFKALCQQEVSLGDVQALCVLSTSSNKDINRKSSWFWHVLAVIAGESFSAVSKNQLCKLEPELPNSLHSQLKCSYPYPRMHPPSVSVSYFAFVSINLLKIAKPGPLKTWAFRGGRSCSAPFISHPR